MLRKKKVLFIATGGTFASIKTQDGLKPGFDVGALLELFPESKQLADIDGIQICNLDSTNVDPSYWTLMAECIKTNYPHYDSFIIAHGTDTMHFSSAALSFALRGIDKPVIFTGSVLSPEEMSSDAKQNFMDSLLVAISDGIYGVLLCFHGNVILGTHARKMNNEATKYQEKYKEVFGTITMPVVGVVNSRNFIKNTNAIYKLQKRGAPEGLANYSTEIALVVMTPGLDSSILDHCFNKKAIIIQTFGPGNIPFAYGNWREKIGELTQKGVGVFITTQNPFGEVDMSKYEVGQKAMQVGAIPCYDMTPEAALTKLMWIFGNQSDLSLEKVKKTFLTNLVGEIRDSYV